MNVTHLLRIIRQELKILPSFEPCEPVRTQTEPELKQAKCEWQQEISDKHVPLPMVGTAVVVTTNMRSRERFAGP